MSDILYIYTDGVCVPNPGAGGWACLLEYKGTRKLLHGSEPDTTNQRMEVLAAIKAFEAVKPTFNGQIIVISDSQYLINGMSGAWKIRTNLDLFNDLMALEQRHSVEWQWVKGHAGHPQNEIVNKLAESEATKLNMRRTA